MASISAAPPPAWKEAAILAILSLAILPAVPFILLFPIGLVAWMGVSVVAAVVTVWAAQYPNPEVKPWGMAAVAHEPSSPVPQ